MSRRAILIAGSALAVVLAITGSPTAKTSGAQARQAQSLTGAGSSFVFPLVSQWVPAMNAAYGIRITYGAVGSGAGIQQIINRTVDFGASDAPLSPDQFAACKGCVQIPWALSATSIPYNVPGVAGGLHLTGSVLAGIFMNQIKKWNDPAIKKLNRGVNLPNLDVTPIYRSDGSGTTYNFTDYLSTVSRSWKSGVGRGTSVNWPTGVGGKGSSGVAAVLARTPGGITYVDVAYSLKNHFTFAAIQNRAGKFARPGLRGIKAAAATIVRVAPNNGGISIVNPAKSQKAAYPICTFTYVIVPKQTPKAKELRTFIHWALTKGQAAGPKLLFAPIPTVVLRASLKALAQVKS